MGETVVDDTAIQLRDVDEISQLIVEKLPQFTLSSDLEVQERACSFLQLMTVMQKLRGKGVEGVGEEMAQLFHGELKPVAPKAQKKVPIPDGLDLETWINEPPPAEVEEDIVQNGIFDHNEIKRIVTGSKGLSEETKVIEPTEEELSERRRARKAEQELNPNYLQSKKK